MAGGMIRVLRDPSWIDRFVSYSVLVDGASVTEVRSGQVVEIGTSQGTHKVSVQAGRGSQPSVEHTVRVEPDAVVSFRCRPNVGRLPVALAALGRTLSGRSCPPRVHLEVRP